LRAAPSLFAGSYRLVDEERAAITRYLVQYSACTRISLRSGLMKRKAHSRHDGIPEALLALALDQFHTMNRPARAVGEIASAIINLASSHSRYCHKSLGHSQIIYLCAWSAQP